MRAGEDGTADGCWRSSGGHTDPLPVLGCEVGAVDYRSAMSQHAMLENELQIYKTSEQVIDMDAKN